MPLGVREPEDEEGDRYLSNRQGRNHESLAQPVKFSRKHGIVVLKVVDMTANTVCHSCQVQRCAYYSENLFNISHDEIMSIGKCHLVASTLACEYASSG